MLKSFVRAQVPTETFQSRATVGTALSDWLIGEMAQGHPYETRTDVFHGAVPVRLETSAVVDLDVSL